MLKTGTEREKYMSNPEKKASKQDRRAPKKASEQDSAAQKYNYKFTIIITAIIVKPEAGDTQGTRKKLGFKNIVREVWICTLAFSFVIFLCF